MENTIYDWLMEKRNPAAGLPEARLFARMLSFRSASAYWTVEEMLGLTELKMKALITKYFPSALKVHKEPECYKINFHAAVNQPFVCHCCGQAVTSRGAITKVDIPLFQGYPTALNRQMEVDDLKGLLLCHRSSGAAETTWFANMIAVGALGEDHLWQDLGLTGRKDVSYILKTYFTDLFNKNTGDMKWKKFFYKQLCDLEDIKVCKAPSCSVCDNYSDCFGPEDAERWAA
ncbi:nitrogen fixation protein NifQ [uncultured Desulfosarcina sp.]|uniref:nitrogen fixation protein NifQ n=1 Tax=uncultured Desulfosarcina sp. TaxID=218289 RepID=UPI0029C6BF35|nr:nitrogen fixation protein NifQ [uncultured Desulfosarcina sp.]